MFLSRAPALRTLRYAVPVLTFPLGAGAEAYVAYAAESLIAPNARASAGAKLLRLLVVLVVPANVLGGLAAYPALINKAIRMKQAPRGSIGGRKRK